MKQPGTSEPLATQDERVAAFARDLAHLSQRYGVVLTVLGGVQCVPDLRSLAGMVYITDRDAGDLYPELADDPEFLPLPSAYPGLDSIFTVHPGERVVYFRIDVETGASKRVQGVVLERWHNKIAVAPDSDPDAAEFVPVHKLARCSQ